MLFLVVAGGIGLVVYNQLQGNQVTVPQGLAGGTCAAAQARLTQAGLNGKCTSVSSTKVDQGHVIRTSPTGGSSVDKGSDVTIFVSAGPSAKELPDVSGKSVADATAALADAGFKKVEVNSTQLDSPKQSAGDVVSTKPKPGKVYPVSTTITLNLRVGQRGRARRVRAQLQPGPPEAAGPDAGRHLHQRPTAPTHR